MNTIIIIGNITKMDTLLYHIITLNVMRDIQLIITTLISGAYAAQSRISIDLIICDYRAESYKYGLIYR